jgi:tetratricopeptide (TPR) repeat protein
MAHPAPAATTAPRADPPDAAPDPGRRPGPLKRAQAHDLMKKGDALRASGDLGGAIRSYLAAEEIAPGLPAIQKKLAVCYQQQGDTQAARARYQRYLATDPPDAAKVRLILENLQ